MTNRPLISLILVTYNSADRLADFFAALAATRDAAYETLVIDNASSDRTAQIVAERYPQARLLANARNVGFGRACNQGAQAARGELLVFLNPDVIVTPDWLAILARHMREHPDAGIICPTTLDFDQRPFHAGAAGPSPLAAGRASGMADTAAVPACAMMVRRAAWEQLGGFDERFFMYWEDTELCWRAWLLGWRVLEDFEACVYHERGGSASNRSWDAERAKNALRTYLKLMRWRRVASFAAVLLAKTLAKIAIRRQPGMLAAWIWNWRHLGETLAWRRELARVRRGDAAKLEQMVAIHERRGRRERRQRSRDS
jgi:GT2 family glycosyltransferase